MRDKETAWNYALGMLQVDGLTTSEEMTELVEMEKRGEITKDDIIVRLHEKYDALRCLSKRICDIENGTAHLEEHELIEVEDEE